MNIGNGLNREFVGVAANSNEHAARPQTGKNLNKCWSAMGAIDVEDLGMFFGSENRPGANVQRSSATSNHRVFRNRNVSAAPLINPIPPQGPTYRSIDKSVCNEYTYGCPERFCYEECSQNGYGRNLGNWDCPFENNDPFVVDDHHNNLNHISINNINSYNRTSIVQSEISQLPCTEEQWLACPAINCPIYDNVYGVPSENVPWPISTANQNGHSGFISYYGNVPPPCVVNNNEARADFDNYQEECCPCYPHCWQDERQFFQEYLSNEKRKEKSRDAARCRRSRETDIFTDLASALPLTKEQVTHLDKASVMRLGIAYLKARSVIDGLVLPPASLTEMDSLYSKALDGFMLILSSNGDMVYLSENVSEYLGVSQMDMMGQSVYEYSHPCDHDELRECLAIKPDSLIEKRPCNFFIRLKSTLTSKGRKVNLKSASYKVIHCVGRAMQTFEPNTKTSPVVDSQCEDMDSSDVPNQEAEYTAGASLVVVGSPIPHPSNIEIPLGRQTFLSKHNLSMKFTYADTRLAEYLGWSSDELLGKSLFEFHHALDNQALEKSFKSLFNKGQCETMAYRFLSKKGGYAWVSTQATLIHCSKQQKPLSVVCVNHILSGVECEDEVYSERQLEARKITEASLNGKDKTQKCMQPLPFIETPTNTDDSYDDTDEDNENTARIVQESCERKNTLIEQQRTRPLSVTASLFRSQATIARKEPPNPVKNTDKRRERWTFQDQPILEAKPQISRPQTVTRNLFVPLGSLKDQESVQQHEQNCRPPHSATASIFAPRTEDMNKGFLTFSEDQPGLTMLKDEPEDLTHLAPTAGDVCVPLEDTPFLSDMLDEFILGSDNYCPLLSPEDLPSGLPNGEIDDTLSKDNICTSIESSLVDSDPFIYRDMPCSLSPDLLSPDALTLGKQSDENSSLQSSKGSDEDSSMIECSPATGNPITEDEMLMLSINDVIGDDELALRAPYIPMSDQDEALQLLISDDTVMWGPSQPPDKKVKWNYEDRISKHYEDSNLARLLKNDTIKYTDQSGGLVDPTQIFGQITSIKGRNMNRLERASKRVHTPLSVTGEGKRSRLNDSVKLPIDQSCDVTSISRTNNLINSQEHSIDLCGVLCTDEKMDTASNYQDQRGGRLLLQQLMSSDRTLVTARDTTRKLTADNYLMVKESISCGKEESRPDVGAIETSRQSNSVLMNLLVSGCDKASKIQLPGKRSPNFDEKSYVAFNNNRSSIFNE